MQVIPAGRWLYLEVADDDIGDIDDAQTNTTQSYSARGQIIYSLKTWKLLTSARLAQDRSVGANLDDLITSDRARNNDDLGSAASYSRLESSESGNSDGGCRSSTSGAKFEIIRNYCWSAV